MAKGKKWKSLAYEKSQQEEAAYTKKYKFISSHSTPDEEEEQNNNNSCLQNNNNLNKNKGVIVSGGSWGPCSPTEGETAPSPPPSWLPAPTAGKVTVLFNGE
jgi:hypothetical protein